MYIAYIDESGYCPNWSKDTVTQRFYVLSAVLFLCDEINDTYAKIRIDVDKLKLNLKHPLGQGCEIKARQVAGGHGPWGDQAKREGICNILLNAPTLYSGAAFMVIVDKNKHWLKYNSPADPYTLALRFLLERIQSFFTDENEYGICIYDQNKHLDDILQTVAATLVRDGSQIDFEGYYGPTSKICLIDRITEFTFGRAEFCLGLQIADFFSTFGFQNSKSILKGKSSIRTWSTIEKNLYRRNGLQDGFGLKKFP